MPHIIVKLYPGRSEEQKRRLTARIVTDVVTIAQCKDADVSVAFEEIGPDEWVEKVYRPDILSQKDKLYKEPGYDPFE